MTDEPPAWPPRADRPPPDAWPPHQPSAPPASGLRLSDSPTAETPTINPPTIDTPTAETPFIATPAFATQVFGPPIGEAPPAQPLTAETPTAETPTAETPIVATRTDPTPIGVMGTDDRPTATVPAVREPVLVGSIVEDDDDRTWHTPIPASQHFQPAHEANWPAESGQQQWLPDIHHDEQWHPQHEQPPADRHPDEQDEADETEQPRGRRTALWLSLALVFTLLLCGGGAVSAYLLLRNADGGGGAPDPATAVTRFLSAVYSEQDPGAANDLLCRESRDTKKMTAKVDEVRGYARTYDGPQFRWAEPAISAQEKKRATVAVDLTMTTRDEKTAQQRLTFTVVRKTGWWVCEVTG